MGGVPLLQGLTYPLAQLVQGGLGEEGHGGLPIADVKVEGAGSFPPEVLVGVEERLGVQAYFVAGGGTIGRR